MLWEGSTSPSEILVFSYDWLIITQGPSCVVLCIPRVKDGMYLGEIV